MGRMPRSKDAIKRALLDLMGQKPFGQISVSEICEAAGVSRTTYYRDYYSQSEVLDDVLDDCFREAEELLGELRPSETGLTRQIDFDRQVTTYEVLRQFRAHAAELEVILASDMSYVLEERIGTLALRELGVNDQTCPVGLNEYLYQEFCLAGMTRITCAWIAGGCEIPIGQMLEFETSAVQALATMEPVRLGA